MKLHSFILRVNYYFLSSLHKYEEVYCSITTKLARYIMVVLASSCVMLVCFSDWQYYIIMQLSFLTTWMLYAFAGAMGFLSILYLFESNSRVNKCKTSKARGYLYVILAITQVVFICTLLLQVGYYIFPMLRDPCWNNLIYFISFYRELFLLPAISLIVFIFFINLLFAIVQFRIDNLV